MAVSVCPSLHSCGKNGSALCWVERSLRIDSLSLYGKKIKWSQVKGEITGVLFYDICPSGQKKLNYNPLFNFVGGLNGHVNYVRHLRTDENCPVHGCPIHFPNKKKWSWVGHSYRKIRTEGLGLGKHIVMIIVEECTTIWTSFNWRHVPFSQDFFKGRTIFSWLILE